MDQSDIIETAHELADAARDVILPWFRSTDLAADNKSNGKGPYDPVTQADHAAEQTMREILARRRPDDGILGEEFGHSSGSTGLTWVLDPIDGTRAFVSGTPSWGVLIALRDDSGPCYGIIDQPYTAERFEGGFGRAQMTGPSGTCPLRSRENRPLEQGILFSTFPEIGTEEEAAAFQAVSRQMQFTRYGLDCYAYALLALGQIDLVIEAGLQAYDVQAPIAVIKAAGGLVTDWRGAPAHEGGRILAAANESQHTAALKILSAWA